ncbi:GntR family transcriptional regulator [Streptomyces rubiginosohelvolus]|uniref:GntR family transcriptional regulator n=1 Tax=Streptomyces rubiginosohelvolus TaxID=67362 RepID=UPI00368C7170
MSHDDRTPAASPQPPGTAGALHPAPCNPGHGGVALLPEAEDQVVGTVRALVASGRYVPGARLTVTELRRSTGHPARRLRSALERLAAEGIITSG